MLFIISIIFLAFFLYDSLIIKKYYSVSTFIFLGIIVPLTLYDFEWSYLIIKERSFYFVYTFTCLCIVYSIYHLLTKNLRISSFIAQDRIKFKKTGIFLVKVINISFVLLYLFENYLGSGYIITTLKGIDIHTFSFPIISYFTNCFYTVIVIDYFAWKASSKKKYIIWSIAIILIPFITRASRMQSVIAIFSVLSLILFFEAGSAKGNAVKEKHFKKMRQMIFISLILLIGGLIALTTYRMNHFGVYNLSYANEIGYCGPEILEFLSPYYGYFPLSFNNLNGNMLMQNVEHNYIGLYSFSCFYYGLLQLDNILSINQYQYLVGRYITTPSATVATGFWEYYYDFGILCFIPVVIALIVCYFLLKCSSREKRRLTFRTLYFWYVPLWFFMSFQNVLFGPIILVNGIILAFLISIIFKVERIIE